MLHAALFLAAVPSAESPEPVDVDWGRFRGPNGLGLVEGTLPETLDAVESLLWAVEIPAGYSSPIVVDGRVILTGATETHLVTLSLDEESGEEVWRREIEYDGKRPGANSSAAPTPATDGKRLFALFHHIGMVAYDLDGEELWNNDLGAPFNIPHGLATSPVLHERRILLQLDQDSGSALVCLDAETGDEVWRTPREGAAHSYSTPAIHAPEEGPAVAIVSGSYEISGYSVETGERLWWVTGSAWQAKAVPLVMGDLCLVSAFMPLSGEMGLPRVSGDFAAALEEHDANGNGMIERDEWDHDMMQQTWFIWDRDGDDALSESDFAYFASTQTAKGGLFAIRLGGKGDVTESHVAWTYDNRRALSDVITPLVVDDVVFLLRDGGFLTALDATSGEQLEDGRVGESDQYYASPVGAGGRMLVAGMSGMISVVDAAADWETIATITLEDAGRVWSTPALSDGRILVRGQQRLFCLAR
ncbi:MAG: PQQ-binding-like beta-propeller repeat protein [Planctomycetota bacterium]